MCHDFMGNSVYLQCFPVGVINGEKVGQIDINLCKEESSDKVVWETLIGLNFLC
jgi:hypothetical protein